MPSRPVQVDAVSARLGALRDRRARYASPDLCDEVRELVVVCSSSRGGSTLFGEILRAHPELLTTSAEINPHLTIPVLGMGPDLLADPSPVCADGEGRDITRAELSLDLGQPADHVPTEVLADHITWRLTMQWPSVAFDPDHVTAWLQGAAGAPSRDRRWVRLLAAIRAGHPEVDPRLYDLDMSPGPDAGDDLGPHADPVVEMAPFVVPREWRHADPHEAAEMPVVLTTPRNAFRLPLLRSLFPNARLRVIHLVRNPASAMNGLRDGWLHPAFFTCRVPEGLNVRGYSDARPTWADWWCYDLPPSWRAMRGASLPQVCATQWWSAHDETVARCDELGLERMVVRFEDVVWDVDTRNDVLVRLAAWLGVDPRPFTEHDALPVLMATEPPRRGRWQDNADVLSPALTDPSVVGWADELGYGTDPGGWM